MISQLSDTIQIPDAPAIPGLTFRHWRDASDYQAIAEIVNAVNLADKIQEAWSTEAIANHFGNLPNSDPARDMLVVEVSGRMVGFCQTSWIQEDDGTRLYAIRWAVHPESRGRDIERVLLHYGERRQRAIAEAHPHDGKRFLAAFAAQTAETRVRLLELAGYRAVRYFYTMVAPLEAIPDVPLPASLETRPAKKEQYRAIFDALDEAFRDHWGHAPPTEQFYQMWLQHPYFDDTLFVIAWDGEKVAGVSVNLINPDENRAWNHQRGWVDTLAVRRPWRKRGLGRALLVESMRLIKARGMTEAQLGVDTENPSGALGLYESVGFKPVQTFMAYRKALE